MKENNEDSKLSNQRIKSTIKNENSSALMYFMFIMLYLVFISIFFK